MNSFQLVGIDPHPFDTMFAWSDAQLHEAGALRRIATESPGFPCRISLEDAALSEELLLLPYRHQGAASPYRASGPIFVRRGVARRRLGIGEVPAYVTRRLISVRAYDADHMMVDAAVVEGVATGAEIERQFGADHVAYIHLHNARQGCFSCEVRRA